ncbi:hypothetical protein A5679_06515 [Mycobacterium scrofulaceum]|uniref:Uncharacterized protein n=2 Tax=Mycobacterium scrofulaceum TaxID=1783 RepID=A0A1A2WCG2_MYCSC|nr:hypothetical protein A5679_06515 [Mycobacterium scrofulaceum]
MRGCFMRSVLVGLLVLFCCGIATAPTEAECQPAEFFVADNADPLFEPKADATIAQGGMAVTGSTPLDGVYWSPAQQRLTFERSREFHLCGPDEPALRVTAEALRHQFDQESVLLFAYLPQWDPEDNAILITVPDVDIARLGDALSADPSARTRLRGGSVTTIDHTLVLVAGSDDRDVARRLVSAAGGNWDDATIAYGRGEFVE